VPEGDTIHRAARNLQQALGGQTIMRFATVLAPLAAVDDAQPIRGRTIERVRAVGKHLLIELSGGIALHTHMRMNGEWHIYRVGERWQRPRRDMRIAIETGEWTAVAFNVTVADFRDASDDPAVGPDLLGETFDAGEARRRLRADANREIGDALLDQQAVAGIGNIWKSETLFVCRVDPFARVASIDDAKLEEILATARKLLRQSVASPIRNRWSVYGRANQPCRRCGAAIRMKKQGDDARVTFWCATCQIQ
jgi:endonuclease-8